MAEPERTLTPAAPHYSSGTWTPEFSSLTVTGAIVATGAWARVGRMIFFEVHVTISSGNTSSTYGTTYINNLPFTASPNFKGQVTAEYPDGSGVGTVDWGTTRAYLPGWTTQITAIEIQGFYIL